MDDDVSVKRFAMKSCLLHLASNRSLVVQFFSEIPFFFSFFSSFSPAIPMENSFVWLLQGDFPLAFDSWNTTCTFIGFSAERFSRQFLLFSRRNIQIEKLQIVVEIWQKIWKEIKTGPIALWVQLIVTEAINFSKISNGRDKNFSRLNL